eukprot:364246-Chlamydomonas_euryale.AAC.6
MALPKSSAILLRPIDEKELSGLCLSGTQVGKVLALERLALLSQCNSVCHIPSYVGNAHFDMKTASWRSV